MQEIKKNSHISIIGLGASGIAAAKLLRARGERLIGMDEGGKDLSDLKDLFDLTLKGIDEELLLKSKSIIISPGISHRKDFLEKARQRGISVIGELSLGLNYLDIPYIAISGTNGKSTVSKLIADLLEASGKKVFLGGNFGTPLCDYANLKEKKDIALIEISSYQLDTVENFKPDVAILLNISPDHLDRYRDYEDYIQSKLRIFKDMDKGLAILNCKDKRLRIEGEKLSIPLKWYNSEDELSILDKKIAFKDGSSYDLSNFSPRGEHNIENLAAAIMAAKAMGASEEGIKKGIENFKPLEHRISFCGKVGEVSCYDDSKATNIDSVCKALLSFNTRLVLIMGGQDKGGDYMLMLPHIKEYAKKLVLIGEAAEKIKECFSSYLPCERADSLEDAVIKALKAADEKTPVLLSPACSSFDMFKDYKERGSCFQKIVNRMGKNKEYEERDK